MYSMSILMGLRNKSTELGNFETVFCLNTVRLKTKTTAHKQCSLVDEFVSY